MVAGVIAKPGFKVSEPEKIRSILSGFDKVWLSPDMGGAAIAPLCPEYSIIEKTDAPYVDRIYAIVKTFFGKGVQCLITIGGDGIASYAACAIIRESAKAGKTMMIAGIPAGTANVGPIVQKDLQKDFFRKCTALDAIEVSSGGKVLGYGFNDVIIGNSFLGTDDEGNWANFDAKALALEGALKKTDPVSRIASDSFKFVFNAEKLDTSFGFPVAQICISTLHQDNMSGRAIFAGLLESAGWEHPAAVAFMDKVAVDSRPETWNKKELRRTVHLCFNEKDMIKIGGLENCASVIIDGNPFVIKNNELIVRCLPEAVKVAGYRRGQ